MDMKIFNYKEMMKEHELFFIRLKKLIEEFRALGTEKYCAQMYDKWTSIYCLKKSVRNILIENISACSIISQEYYSHISALDGYDANVSLYESNNIANEYKELYEIVSCAMSEMDYVMYLSRYNEEHKHNIKLKKEKVEEFLKSFEDFKTYLSEKGNPYDI